ncbi:MAG: type II toxin-antitoxin system HicA family toxin [Saprospiraceae bacterium]|nr:type II toxin-antitoxin system HicA family toxin [Candidatus Defluviibacterium haderslevense]
MGKIDKLVVKVLTGQTDHNINFNELCNLLVRFGFSKRIKGSHHIFYKENVIEILNLQEVNGKAKPYQVKQVRELILIYKFKITNNDEI